MAQRTKVDKASELTTQHLINLLSSDIGPSVGAFLTSDMSLRDAYLWNFRRSVLKKFKALRHPDAGTLAIDSFIADNVACERFVLQPTSWFDDYLIGGVKTLLEKWLHDDDGCPPTLLELTDLSRCGPGSSVGIDIATFYTKLFASTLSTANPDLRRLYSAVTSKNPTWARAEETRESHYGNDNVIGSQISLALKSFAIDRTIAKEPILEMFFQLGLGGYMEFCLKRVGINLSTQPNKNRELARRGSLDGEICTIDLRSASNLNATSMIMQTFPRSLVAWMLRCRCKKAVLPSGEVLDLHMVATMGNGYCFPLQTMLFASIVCTVYDLLDLEVNFGSSRESGFLEPLYGGDKINAGVFGDDICVVKDAYSLVCRGLELFGHVVNHEKSFSEGEFRESCGHDYFRGVNIRGVYLKTIATREDRYSAINRLVRWSTASEIPLDFTITWLLSQVGFTPIPFCEGDDLGIKVPRSWSGHWYSLSSQGSSQLYWVKHYEAEKYRFVEDPSAEYTIRGLPTILNKDGYVVSFVGGYIRGGFVSLRSDREDGTASGRAKVSLRSVPDWDYVERAVRVVDLRGHSWEATIERALALAYPRWQYRIV